MRPTRHWRCNFRSVLAGCCLIFLFCLITCQQPEPTTPETSAPTVAIDQRSYRLGGIGAFAEMVGAGVKTLALSAAMPAEQMDALVEEARGIAQNNGAEIYLEKKFLVTDLFASDLTEGMQVLLIYRGQTLQAYMHLKERKRFLVESDSYVGDARTEIAREMGRLLSYPEERITALLAQQQSESS